MDDTNQSFSVGIWLVKSGREDDFVTAWGDFAKHVFNQNLGGRRGLPVARYSATMSLYFQRALDSIQKIEAWRQWITLAAGMISLINPAEAPQ